MNHSEHLKMLYKCWFIVDDGFSSLLYFFDTWYCFSKCVLLLPVRGKEKGVCGAHEMGNRPSDDWRYYLGGWEPKQLTARE